MRAAGGALRCGACSELFLAQTFSVDHEPSLEGVPSVSTTDEDVLRAKEMAPPGAPETQAEATLNAAVEGQLQSLYFEPEDPADLVGEISEPSYRHQWLWVMGVALLLFSLSVQYVWYERDRLAQNETLRPHYQQFCRFAGCELQAYKNLSVLMTTGLIVRSHPTLPGALKVDAIIKNSGAFEQTFPNLTLTFTDINSKKVAQRTFKPADYLSGELTGLKYFPAFTEVRLSLEIVDPGKAALGYSLMID